MSLAAFAAINRFHNSGKAMTMLSFRHKLVSGIFAISLALAPLAAFAGDTSYTIPWKGVAAKDCAVITHRAEYQGEIGVLILLRCAGQVDIAVGQFAERTK